MTAPPADLPPLGPGAVLAVIEALPGVEIVVRPVADRRLPCAPDEACVIVADGSVDVDLPADQVDSEALDLRLARLPEHRGDREAPEQRNQLMRDPFAPCHECFHVRHPLMRISSRP